MRGLFPVSEIPISREASISVSELFPNSLKYGFDVGGNFQFCVHWYSLLPRVIPFNIY